MSTQVEDSPPAALPRRSGLVIPLAVLAGAALIALAVWLAARPVPPLLQGMAEADEIRVAAKITGRIAAFEVSEGDRVEPGQLLFLIDSPELEARRRQVEAALAAARAQLDKAEEGARRQEVAAARAQWQRAESGAELARTTYQRMRNLHAEGVISRQQYDEAAAQSRAATAQAQAARAQFDLALEGAREEDRRAAAAQLQQAEGAMAEIEAMLEETRIRAPAQGVVSRRAVRAGELVPAGYPVMTLLPPGGTWVAVHVREDQFAGWQLDAVVPGDVPALGLRGVRFKVYFINPAGDFATWRATRESSGYDVRSFEVRLRPIEPLAELRPGMSVLFHSPD